jgi:hypothetical protein
MIGWVYEVNTGVGWGGCVWSGTTAKSTVREYYAEIRYCEIIQRDVVILFWLAVFCLFEARITEFDNQAMPPNSLGLYTVYSVHCTVH